ncbi:MAG: hypothetical protein BWK80_59425, partial [Desulfobacteraceae bacterium IS3]
IFSEFQFIPEQPLIKNTAYAAVKKGNTALAEAVKQGMNLITADERAAIERKWLNASSVKTRDTLVISTVVNIAPFMFLNTEGKPAGMFADIWRLWSEKTGKKIEFLPADTWKTAIENIRNGKADIHIGLFNTDQYEGIGFSQPFYEAGVSIFVSIKTGKVSQITELFGQSIGAVRGTSQERYLKESCPDINVIGFDTRDEMIYAARDGKTKGFISVSAFAESDLSRLGLSGDFDSLPGVLYTGKFCAGVPKENTELLSLADKGFDAISDKELAEIEKRWIPDPEHRYFKPDMKKVRLTAEEQAWLNTAKTVRFGFVEGAEPVSYYENNEYKGLHTDYLRLISERTGIRFEYVPVVQAEFDSRAYAHEFDMFPSFNVPQRKSYSDFTNPIMEMTSVIITRSDEQFISSISVLKGKKIAVLKGFGLNKPLFDKHPEIRLIQKKTMLETLKEVSDFKADAAVLPTLSACWQIQKHNLLNLRIAGIADHPPEPYMYGIRKEYPELFSIVNKAIDSITGEEHEAILQKWFSVRVEHKADWSEVLHWIFGISVVFIAILGITFFWNRRLQETKRKYEFVINSTGQVVYDYHVPSGHIVWGSAIETILGYSLSEIAGGFEQWKNLLHPNDKEKTLNYLKKSQDKCGYWDAEYRMKHKAGHYVWTRDRGYFLPDAKGKALRQLGAMEDISEQKKAKENELIRLRYETELSKCSRALLNEGPVEQIISRVLPHLLKASDCSRVYIFENFEDPSDGLCMRQTYEVCAEHVESQTDNPILQHIPYSEMSFLTKKLGLGQWYGGTVSSLPDYDRSILEPQNILSILILPIFVKDKWFGFIGFDDCIHERLWIEWDIRVLKIAAEMIGSFIGRRHVEDSLRESEEKYRYLTESINDVLWTLDIETLRFTYISPSVVKLRGYTPEEIMAEPMDAALSPEHAAHVRRLIDMQLSAFRENETMNYPQYNELQQPCKDGSLVWTEAVTRYSRNPKTGKIEAHGVTRNISERKNAENALRESEEKYRSLVENLNDVLYSADKEGVILYVSPAVETVFGYRPEEIVGRSYADFIYTEDLPVVYNYAKNVLAGQEVIQEYRIYRKSGESAWIRTSNRATYNEEGRVIGFYGLMTDITARRQTEEALRAERSNLNALLDAAPVCILIVDAGYCITKTNQAAERLFAKKSDEFLNMRCGVLIACIYRREHPGGCGYSEHCPLCPMMNALKRCIIHGQRTDGEEMEACLDNGQRWLRFNVNTVIIEGNRCAVVALDDITERKQAEEYLRQNEARLESLLRISQYRADSVKNLLDYALDEAIRLTTSKIGYIYYYNEESKEFTLNTWSEEVMKECSVAKPKTLYHLDKTGIWGEAVRQRRPIVLNDFQAPHPL